mmetsp:Transcript_14237/g.28562  ORF Transcript_14237/g.28562 Transcript_14237/m.28562 type:complete len:681 (-) Transcript_14237:102-2144(-)
MPPRCLSPSLSLSSRTPQIRPPPPSLSFPHNTSKSQEGRPLCRLSKHRHRHKEEEEEEEEEDGVAENLADGDAGETARLYLTNLAYSCSEADLRSLLAPFGELVEVHIRRREDTGAHKGSAFAQFVFPEHALAALSRLHLSVFQGRLLHVRGAAPKPVKGPAMEKVQGGRSKAKSSFKKEQEERRRKQAGDERSWNLLFVSANAAVDSVAASLGVEKRELMDLDSDALAVRVALGETAVLGRTREWLRKEGIRLDAFERKGATLLTASASAEEGGKARSDDTLIVKHLPAHTTADDLKALFKQHGRLEQISVAPSGTCAVVRFDSPPACDAAFKRLVYRPFKGAPLYLERAPEDLYVKKKPQAGKEKGSKGKEEREEEEDDEEAPSASVTKTRPMEEEEEVDEEEDESAPTPVSLFVKNLAFKTTDEALSRLFSKAKGFRNAVVMKKKKAAVKKQTKGKEEEAEDGEGEEASLSMGYGFVEFDSHANARGCMKKMQGVVLDGHELELRVSANRGGGAVASSSAGKGKEASGKTNLVKAGKQQNGGMVAIKTNKLLVRNLAFEASKKDVRRLFSAYGQLAAVRIPKKADGNGRGFAFVDFVAKADAATAAEALQHTHLYGRRLVIEPASEDSGLSTESAMEKARKAVEGVQTVTESAARRKKLKLDAADGANRKFEDNMDD